MRSAIPTEPATMIVPSSTRAQSKISAMIAQGRRTPRSRGGDLPAAVTASGGFYVAPAIFTDVKADAAIAREESSGPVWPGSRCATSTRPFALANATDNA